jgi:hypothetical protein
MEFQLYKVKFSNGEAVRKELFAQLQDYNDKLEKLLGNSDRDASLRRQRTSVQHKNSADGALCNFWTEASRLFGALASAWNCSCKAQHRTNLLLQHRTSKESEFSILFATLGSSKPSAWELQQTRISEANTTITDAPTSITPPAAGALIRQPAHRQREPLKPALRSKIKAIGFETQG